MAVALRARNVLIENVLDVQNDHFMVVQRAHELLETSGYQVDSIVLLEEPKLASHNLEIRRNLATALGLELCDVSLKAKTMEGLGPIGERRAIAAEVVVLLEEIKK
jgi:2-C-methyl-D-erythritol 2,4-cyclodiphosphate synthase